MLLNKCLRFLFRRSPSICSASTRHLSSAAAAPRFSISDNAFLILRSRLLTYSSNWEDCWCLGIAFSPSCPAYSGAFLPPSPPGEKATACQDQARQASAYHGAGD